MKTAAYVKLRKDIVESPGTGDCRFFGASSALCHHCAVKAKIKPLKWADYERGDDVFDLSDEDHRTFELFVLEASR